MYSITNPFNEAAERYDKSASPQRQIAHNLVVWAAEQILRAPQNMLDLGCGTGFVTEAVHQQWPKATLTAFDASTAMLEQTRHKIPSVQIIQGDAANAEFTDHYDAIFSSMMLHWLLDPLAALRHWQKALEPAGNLYIALLVQGSFQEWRDLCHQHNQPDGLWSFPSKHFTEGAEARLHTETLTFTFPTAQEFLNHLKLIGAATPHAEHKPLDAGSMRRLLSKAPQPFPVTYRVLYLAINSFGSI
jgi:malonyl-CoA O-methyltransferase